LKAVKRQSFELPKDFVKGFTKAHLIHIRQYGTGIELVPTDSVGFDATIAEPFVIDGGNRYNLEAFQISLVLEQLSNTSAYPAVLDLDKGHVFLEANFSRNVLTVIGLGSGYCVNLKLISSERREACWQCDGTGQAVNEDGLLEACTECHKRGYVPVVKAQNNE
jgi:hypothetical protein